MRALLCVLEGMFDAFHVIRAYIEHMPKSVLHSRALTEWVRRGLALAPGLKFHLSRSNVHLKVKTACRFGSPDALSAMVRSSPHFDSAFTFPFVTKQS